MDLKFKHLIDSTDVVYKDDLLRYFLKSDLTPIIDCYYTSYGQTLNIEPHTMYFIQCFNSSGDIQSLRIVGNGNRNGEDGKMAFIITGSSIDENLCIMQTGSIVISNLVVTDSRVTGIKPSNNNGRLKYFKISGYAAASI